MFKFNLEVVLNHRRYEEEICQKVFAEAKKKLAVEQARLHRKKKEIRRCMRDLQRKQKESKTVSDILLYVNYLKQLSKEIKSQMEKVLAAEKKMIRKRKDLISAMKKRKTLEKLKEKRWIAYQQKTLKQEQKFIDEVAVNQFNRHG